MTEIAEKKYLLFAATGVGLGHLMGAILGCAYYAYRTGRVFVMDMREVIFFKDDAHSAFFENFELEVPAGLEVVTDVAFAESLKNEPDLHFVNLGTPLDVDRPFPQKVVMVPCITPGDPYGPSVRRDDEVFRIHLRQQLKEALSRAMGLPYWTKSVIGLHYRATMGELFERMTKLTVPDYDERYAVVKDNYVTTALKLVEGLGPDDYAFLVASDDRDFVREIKQRLPNAFSIGTLRLDQEFMAYMRANKHDLAILVDAVTDLWALSNCEQLVYSRSAFTHFAIINSPHLDEYNTHYIHMPLFDEILASLPADTAVEWAQAAVRKIEISRMHYDKMFRFLAQSAHRAGQADIEEYALRRARWHDQAAHSPEVDNPDMFAERAQERQGRRDLALARARRATERMPDNPYLFGGFGGSLSTLLLDRGEVDAAIEAGRHAVALDPRDAFLRDHLGQVLLRAGRLTAAEAACREAIGLAPDVASFHVNHADILSRLDRIEEAQEAASTGVALDPENGRAQTTLGEILLRREAFNEAEAVFRKADALTKGDIGVQHRLSIVLERQERFAEALALAEQTLEKQPDNPEFKRRVLFLMMRSGDAHRAELAIRSALAEAPADAVLYRALIENLSGRGSAEALEQALRDAAWALPNEAEFQVRHGAHQLAIGRHPEAEQALRRAAHLAAGDVGVQHLLSIALERQNKLADAVIVAVCAHKLEPANPDRTARVLALAQQLSAQTQVRGLAA